MREEFSRENGLTITRFHTASPGWGGGERCSGFFFRDLRIDAHQSAWFFQKNSHKRLCPLVDTFSFLLQTLGNDFNQSRSLTVQEFTFAQGGVVVWQPGDAHGFKITARMWLFYRLQRLKAPRSKRWWLHVWCFPTGCSPSWLPACYISMLPVFRSLLLAV